MGNNINPITFFGTSSIIENGQSGLSLQLDSKDVKQAFLKLLLEKVYLNNFQMAAPLENVEDFDGEDMSIFRQDIGNSFVNDMFRQQIADQLIQTDAFNLSDLGGTQ